jgi:hypothetical protein
VRRAAPDDKLALLDQARMPTPHVAPETRRDEIREGAVARVIIEMIH